MFGVALGLSMDAFAVSVANGLVIHQLKFRHAFRISLFFGAFQAFMPVLGWLAGTCLSSLIQHIAHWVAFFLLLFIGIKMIVEAKSRDRECSSRNCLHFPTLLVMSLATSIDALAVGVSFAVLKISIFLPIAIIGAVTFVVCIIGVYIGDRTGHIFENKLETAGGILLIGIGIKILLEHLVGK